MVNKVTMKRLQSKVNENLVPGCPPVVQCPYQIITEMLHACVRACAKCTYNHYHMGIADLNPCTTYCQVDFNFGIKWFTNTVMQHTAKTDHLYALMNNQ